MFEKDMMVRLSIVALSFLLSSMSCGKKNDVEVIDLRFEIPINIYPAKDTINIGDTIFVEANVPDTLFEITLKRYFKVDPKFLSGDLVFQKLTDPSKYLLHQPSNAASYDGKAYIGELGQPSATFRSFKFQKDGNLQRIRFALVPKTSGVHFIGTISDYITYGGKLEGVDLGLSATGKKLYPRIWTMHYRSIPGQGEAGYNILKQHCAQRIQTDNDPDNSYYLKDGAYTFVVK